MYALYTRCIKGHLCKLGKIVVLVTHQLQYVSECDTVLALKEVSNVHLIMHRHMYLYNMHINLYILFNIPIFLGKDVNL